MKAIVMPTLYLPFIALLSAEISAHEELDCKTSRQHDQAAKYRPKAPIPC
jgi:hypothetical protein